MRESNTPGVGAVLRAAHLEYVPEAHCYLKYNGCRVDLTRYGAAATEEIDVFFVEIPLRAQELVIRKSSEHRRFLTERYGIDASEAIWQVRENCIAALSFRQVLQ